MEKFFRSIVKKKKTVIIVFVTLSIVSIFCQKMVSVNYNLNDYLPEDSQSTKSIEVMEKEFDGGIPNVRVMVNNVTVPEALEYKEKIAAVDGVTDVIWLDDSISVAQPIEMADKDTVENYYKDNSAIYTITMDDSDETASEKTLNDIRAIIGDDNQMAGSAVVTSVAATSTVTEIYKIATLAVIICFIVLFLTTTTWIEPLLVMCSLGVAVLINAGSNIIMGEISFVTNAAGNILQLAVSLDYSVFLLHRFEEYRKKYNDPEEAMVQALCKSTSSILSSGLTTVIGFLALCLMRFGIGSDLGIALAKGIAISLITVFVFSPVLFLYTYKLIDKTHHRSFMPKFEKLGKVVGKVMIPLSCIFALLIVPAYLASISNDYYYGPAHIFNEKTELGADTQKIEDVFGQSDNYVLLVPNTSTATEKELVEDLKSYPQVTGIISYVEQAGAEIPKEYLDKDTLSKLVSDNYSRIIITVKTDPEGKETFDLVQNIRDLTQKYYPDKYYLAGESVSTYDLMDTVTADMIKVNAVAIGAVFLVLVISMRSVILPVILVLAIETAIWINMAVPYFQGSTVFYIAYLIISSIQLGATVDYAILMTDRYKELRQTYAKKDAVVKTISAVTVSILTSATVLTSAGFLLGYISTHGLLAQLGIFLGKGTLCSLVIVLFVLPGLLYIFDGMFIKKDKKNKKNSDNKTDVKDIIEIKETETV